jgi:hypothetical protein
MPPTPHPIVRLRHSVLQARLAPLVVVLLGLMPVGPLAAPARAEPGPAIFLHLREAGFANPCANWGGLADCDAAVTAGGLATRTSGPYYFAYLVAAPHEAIPDLGRLEFGITYENGLSTDRTNRRGIDIYGWFLCATLEFASIGWPAPGLGNLITWDTILRCQTVPFAVAGYFYVGAYHPDRLTVTPRPLTGKATFWSCDESVRVEVDPAHLGYAEFSAGAKAPGCVGCNGECAETPIPVIDATWSRIKSQLSVD